MQKNLGVTIVKNYKNSELTTELFQGVVEEIKSL